MNKIIVPKFPEAINVQKQFIMIRQMFAELITLRVQAEEQYSKGLMKTMNKIQNIEKLQAPFDMIMKSIKSNLFERMQQIKNYSVSLINQKEILEGGIKKNQQQLSKAVTEIKLYEKELKKLADTINRSKSKIEEQIRIIDQKIILQQVSKLKNGSQTNSQALFVQQKNLKGKFEEELVQFRKSNDSLRKKVKKRQKILKQQHENLESEYIDWVKKILVEEVSLIRNLQYDTDSMIKNTNIFNMSQQKKDKEQIKVSKTLKSLGQIQLKIFDPYEEIKTKIIFQKSEQPQKNGVHKEIDGNTIKQILQSKDLQKQYEQNKLLILTYIQSYRLKNIYKFKKEDFQILSSIFTKFLNTSYEHQDFSIINKLILYGSSYCCEMEGNEKLCILDAIKKQKYLKDIQFWKFLLLISLRQTIQKCRDFEKQKQLHIRNNVFSTLVSNSLSMIGCGLDKQQVKNTIAKMSKSFGLLENQTNDLIKFIQAGHESYKKAKNK